MLPKEVVNIVSIVGTRSMWVANPKTVADVLAERFREAGYQINLLSDLDDLESLIRSQRENVVLINAHGESFPMHEKWGKDWLGYFKSLGHLVKDFGWTVTSITGYPFFYYSQGGTATRTEPLEGVNGLGAFISPVQGQVRGAVWAQTDILMEGRTAASWLHALLPERLWISRCFVWDNPTPTKTYYSAGPFVGAASIPMGRGFLIYNGMMSTDFGTSPSEYSDTLLAQYASIFTLDTVRRLVRAKVVEYPTQVLNELKRDLSDELPKLVETIPKREREVQKHVNTVLGLRYKDLDFRWEQFEFPYSIKSYKPDFISERASIAIDVKLCKKEARARGLVDEINADITAYKTHFGWILFLVYDTDKWIEDPMSFTGDFERHNAGVLVSVVTHRHKQK